MKGTLLLAILTIKSRYSDVGNDEVLLDGPADVPDTVQWWIPPKKDVWRIRTFALDRDIHTMVIVESALHVFDYMAMALANNQKNYGDVMDTEHTLTFADCHNEIEVRAQFESIGLPARLEVAGDDFAFWKPDDAEYATKTIPSHFPSRP
jgi:hypothetical protein